MSLVVEDGTGLVNAESYGSVAEADTYHANIGNTAWAALATPQKEQAMRVAANWMMGRFRQRWLGWRAQVAQRLDWPRIGVYIHDTAAFPQHGRLSSFAYMVPTNSVPEQVKNAQFEAALLASTQQLTPQQLKQNRLQVRAGPVFVQYDARSPQMPRYPYIVELIAILLDQTGASIRIAR